MNYQAMVELCDRLYVVDNNRSKPFWQSTLRIKGNPMPSPARLGTRIYDGYPDKEQRKRKIAATLKTKLFTYLAAALFVAVVIASGGSY